MGAVVDTAVDSGGSTILARQFTRHARHLTASPIICAEAPSSTLIVSLTFKEVSRSGSVAAAPPSPTRDTSTPMAIKVMVTFSFSISAAARKNLLTGVVVVVLDSAKGGVTHSSHLPAAGTCCRSEHWCGSPSCHGGRRCRVSWGKDGRCS